jgi:hypothetical protein
MGRNVSDLTFITKVYLIHINCKHELTEFQVVNERELDLL